MNRKTALRVMVMKGMEIVPNILQLSSIFGNTILLPFIPMHPCSFLTCGISVGEKPNSGCDCVLLHVDGKTSL